MRYFERGLSKSLKKVNFIFSFELLKVPFNGQNYYKQKEPGTLHVSKQFQKNSFISYVLSDQVL